MAEGGKSADRTINRAAMERLLATTADSAAGLILQLTWRAGLTVEELCTLRWSDVSLAEKKLWTGQRWVSLKEDTVSCLQHRLEQQPPKEEDFVLLTDSRSRSLSPDSVYRLARRALDREETLRGITLKMLRQDHWLRGRQEENRENEYALWKAMQAEGASTAGIAIWMLWRLGLRLQEIVDLTWENVDLHRGVLCLPRRWVPMGVTLLRLLRQLYQTRWEEDDPHVLLTPKSRRPYEPARLSRCVEAALRREGIHHLRPGELSRMHIRQETEKALLRCLEHRGSLSRQAAAKQLGLSPASAYRRLAALTEHGKLERIGGKYYPAGTTIPAEELENIVCQYLCREEGADCRQLAELLGIESRQCSRILRRMVREGRLVLSKQRYHVCRGEAQ